MAILYEGVCCPLCNRPLDLSVDNFATSGPFFPEGHPLFRFCDAGIHWDCYANWPHRLEFARASFESDVEGMERNFYWGLALLTDRVAVTVSIDIGQVDVRTATTGGRVRVRLEDWTDWLANFDSVTQDSAPLEQEALREVLPELRSVLPTADHIIGNVDWGAKNTLKWERIKQCHVQEIERLRKTRAYNQACRQWMSRGVFCPYCGSEDIQFEDRGSEQKSQFYCTACAYTFGPPEATAASSFGVYLKDAPNASIWRAIRNGG